LQSDIPLHDAKIGGEFGADYAAVRHLYLALRQYIPNYQDGRRDEDGVNA
jgi:hypothetical protein